MQEVNVAHARVATHNKNVIMNVYQSMLLHIFRISKL
jgi:hypothetical protein